jgi:GMP synthase-like glutamine amidotransferase
MGRDIRREVDHGVTDCGSSRLGLRIPARSSFQEDVVMLITAVGNDGDDDLGLLYPALESLTGRVVVSRIDRSAPTGTWSLPERTDLMLLLGSDWSVYRRTGGRSVHAESRLARRMIACGVPVLGVCYGAQLLAHALRGSCEASPVPELGWVDVHSGEPALAGRWFQWHGDRAVQPIGATVSAATFGNIQAWHYRCGFAIQFHPEVTDDILRRWCATGAHELKKQGVEPDSFFADRPADDVPRLANLLQHVLSTTEGNTYVAHEPHRPCDRTG